MYQYGDIVAITISSCLWIHNQFADHKDIHSLFCGKISATPNTDTIFKM